MFITFFFQRSVFNSYLVFLMQTSFDSYTLTTTPTLVQLSNIFHPLFKELFSHFFPLYWWIFCLCDLISFYSVTHKNQANSITLEQFSATKPVPVSSPKEDTLVQFRECKQIFTNQIRVVPCRFQHHKSSNLLLPRVWSQICFPSRQVFSNRSSAHKTPLPWAEASTTAPLSSS